MKSKLILLLSMSLAVSITACAKEEQAAPAEAADKAVAVHAAEVASKSIEERMANGEKLYAAHCSACHQAAGQGLAGAFPPLAESSYLADGGTGYRRRTERSQWTDNGQRHGLQRGHAEPVLPERQRRRGRGYFRHEFLGKSRW
jgi:mono/diheme cytochrome c family protein